MDYLAALREVLNFSLYDLGDSHWGCDFCGAPIQQTKWIDFQHEPECPVVIIRNEHPQLKEVA